MTPTLSAKAPIRELNLPPLVAKKLKAPYFNNIADVVAKTPEEMEKILTSKSGDFPALALLEAYLYDHGLVLGTPYEGQTHRPQVSPTAADKMRPLSVVLNRKSAREALAQRGKNTLGDLTEMTYLELLKVPNLGPDRVRALTKEMSEMGMRLKPFIHQNVTLAAEASDSLQEHPMVLDQIEIAEPLLVGDTIQSTGTVFLLPTTEAARYFHHHARARLDKLVDPSEASEFCFAVKHVGMFDGKPAVYIQENALQRIEDTGISLKQSFNAEIARVEKLFGNFR
jgi:hypothetical protein